MDEFGSGSVEKTPKIVWVALATPLVVLWTVFAVALMTGATPDREELEYTLYGVVLTPLVVAAALAMALWRTRRRLARVRTRFPGAPTIFGTAAEMTDGMPDDHRAGAVLRVKRDWAQRFMVVAVLPDRLEVWGNDRKEGVAVLDRGRLQVSTVEIWAQGQPRYNASPGLWLTDGDRTILIAPTNRYCMHTKRARSQALADLEAGGPVGREVAG